MEPFDLLCERVKARLAQSRHRATIDTAVNQAAVALILRRNLGAAELLVIKRAVRVNDHWSGHLGLPGGRWQPDDPDLLATARRETEEEVGIDLSSGGQVLGQLETLKPRNPLIPQVEVTPFVFCAPPHIHIVSEGEVSELLRLNHEVAAAFWLPVEYLRSAGLSDSVAYLFNGEEQRWPAYPSAHGPIWGLTERMLTSFLMESGESGESA